MTRILYIEDNDDNVYMLRLRLEIAGEFDLRVAQDGEAGLSAARAERPDLILMDLNLPGIDGWEAARRLKADPRTCDIPIVALTAHAMAGDRERALEAGCDDFDIKPIDLERLLGKIRALALTGRRQG